MIARSLAVLCAVALACAAANAQPTRSNINLAGQFSIESTQWPGNYLYLDGTGLTSPQGAGGGKVGCHHGENAQTQFEFVHNPDGSTSIRSVAFPNLYVRLDAGNLHSFQGNGGGTLNAQYGIGPWEEWYLVTQPGFKVGIASRQWAGSWLRLNCGDCSSPRGCGSAGGGGNAQFYGSSNKIGPYETFTIS